MRHPRRVASLSVLLLTVVLSLPVANPASARTASSGAVLVPMGGRTAAPDKWWGVAGAVLCGTGIRLVRVAPEIGMNPYVLAATIGGCLLAALDCT